MVEMPGSIPKGMPELSSPISHSDSLSSLSSILSSSFAEDGYVLEPSNRTSSNDGRKNISINIADGVKHIYRHAREMKICHGGLKGTITLPPDYETSNYRLVLSVIPSIKSKQIIHGCMLHVTIINQNVRNQSLVRKNMFRTELKSPKDWRLLIDIEDGQAFYVPNYGTRERFRINCLRNGELFLGAPELGNRFQVRYKHR